MTTPAAAPASDQQQAQQKNASAHGSILGWLRSLYDRQLPLHLGFWQPRSRVDNPAVQYDTKKAGGYALSVVVQHVRSSVDLLMVKPAVRVMAVDRGTGSVIGIRGGVSTAVRAGAVDCSAPRCVSLTAPVIYSGFACQRSVEQPALGRRVLAGSVRRSVQRRRCVAVRAGRHKALDAQRAGEVLAATTHCAGCWVHLADDENNVLHRNGRGRVRDGLHGAISTRWTELACRMWGC